MPFLGGNRPRVPSNDALKVLYQLAYISSGTAVGVGVLCTEERRRRARLVQRIADNAKRIRQSPRYIHNAAVAVREAEEWGRPEGYEAASPLEAREGNSGRSKRRKTDVLRDERTSRGAELPTAVEDGYDQLHAQQPGDRKPKPRRRRRSDAHTSDLHPQNAPISSTASSQYQEGAIGQHRTPHNGVPHKPTCPQGIPDATAAARLLPGMSSSRYMELAKPISRIEASSAREVVARNAKQFRANLWSCASTAPDQERSATADFFTPTTRDSSSRTKQPRKFVLADRLPAKSECSHGLAPSRMRSVAQAESAKIQGYMKRLREGLDVCSPTEALLILQSGSKYLAHDSEAHALVYDFLDRTITAGDISTATSIVAVLTGWNLRFGRQDLDRCERLLSFLDAYRAHQAICQLFGPNGLAQDIKVKALSEKSNEIIAFACTQTREPGPKNAIFKAALRQVSPKNRGRIMDSSSILTLINWWETTRNLRLVEERASLMRKLAEDSSHVKLARREIDETLLDILIESGDNRVATTHLSHMRERSPDGLPIVMGVCLMLAKRGDWQAVNSMLESAALSEPTGFEALALKRFNAIVRLHGQAHSPTQTWSFVTRAMEKVLLLPNQSTTDIMLESFVKHKAPHYIPLWITHILRLGQKVAFDSTLAARLLTEYYMKYRPNHILVMWLCRNTSSRAPSLAGREYSELVKAAIAFDVRTISGQHHAWRRENAQKRLELVEQTKGDIVPSPGAVYDTTPHLLQPDATNRRTFGINHSDAISSEFVGSSSHGFREPDTPFEAHLTEHSEAPEEASSAQSRVLRQGSKDLDSIRWPETITRSSSQPRPVTLTSPADVDALYWDGDLQTVAEEVGEAGYPVPESLSPSSRPGPSTLPEGSGRTPLPRLRPRRAPSGVERDMLVASALRDQQKVLTLYHDSRDAAGLPASMLALEVAVSSALQLENGQEIAHAIIEQAKQAGCNTSCALGPLLLHRIRQALAGTNRDMKSLKRAVFDYYRLNEENGRPVRHTLVVLAARTLIHLGKARAGVDILRTMQSSDRTNEVPLDIVGMTTFMYGYGALKDHTGVEWVFSEVLRRDLRISTKFIQVASNIHRKMYGTKAERTGNPSEKASGWRMRQFIRLCKERKIAQAREATVQGRQLVNALVKTAKILEMPAVSLAERRAIEADEFGEPVPASLVMAADCGNMNPIYASRRQLRRARDRLPERPLDVKRADLRWTTNYRRFLRHNLVSEDGRLASFRYRLSNEREASVAEKQRRRAQRALADSRTGSDAVGSVPSP